MSEPRVTTLELRVIDQVLLMENGYVLDFTDRTYAEFFRDFGIDIDHPRYRMEGGSKAKRLRYFLRTQAPPTSGTALAALLKYRLAMDADLDAAAWQQAAEVAARLGGSPPPGPAATPVSKSDLSEEALLNLSLDRDAVRRAARSPELAAIVLARMEEVDRCVKAEAYLSATILAGSVLEALSLDFGAEHPERVNRAFEARYGKKPPPLPEWNLNAWIDVLGSTGDLSPNIEKFGHALREFRNYVHPKQQLLSGFSPDKHTAIIGHQVVVAAVDDLAAARARLEQATS